MAAIDEEIDALQRRLAALEEKKRAQVEQAKVEVPLLALEEFIEDKKKKIVCSKYSNSAPLARFYDQEKVAYLEPILILLKNLTERLDRLEKRE